MHYGWVIVGVGIVVTCLGIGSMMSLGVYLQPIGADMGWSTAGVSAASAINFLSLGLAAFVWGALSDRYGTRVVVLAGGVILGAGLMAASRATALWEFQLVFGIAIGTAAGSSYTPMITTTARWFTTNRSLAVAMVSIGLGIGSMVMAPLAGWLIQGWGWRTAMFTTGLIAWAVVIPLALLVRRPPTEPALAGIAAGAELSLGQAVRTPQFAVLALTHFACCAAHSGPIFHMARYASACGVEAFTAATVFTAAGVGGLFGRVLGGMAADRYGVKPVMLVMLVLQAAGIAAYLMARDLSSLYVLSVAFGFAYGGVMPLYALIVRQQFGQRSMGSTFGAITAVSTLGMALGPLIGGWIFDRLGAYTWMHIGAAVIGLGAVAIFLTFRAPRPLVPPHAVPAAS
jgi:MFS family permease